MSDKVVDFAEFKKQRDKAKESAKQAIATGVVDPQLLSSLCEVIDNQDTLMGMIVTDIQILAHKVAQLEGEQFNAGLYIENIQTVLREKLNVSENDFREFWNRDIVPRLKELKEAQDKVMAEAEAKKKASESRIIIPNNNIITPK